jgi:hypothetical protein
MIPERQQDQRESSLIERLQSELHEKDMELLHLRRTAAANPSVITEH